MDQVLNVILNGFNGRIRGRIIEETLKPFTVGSCVSIIRRSEDLPNINSKKNIRHDPSDLNTMDWNEIRPLDERMVYSMRDCEAVFMHMMDRREWMGRSYSYGERKRLYLQNLRYWNHIIEEEKINLFLSSTLPHRIRTYVIYALCKEKGIPTIFPFHAGHVEGDFLMVEDLVDFCPELELHHNELKEKYSNNDDPIKLPERYEQYILSQTVEGEDPPKPWYMELDDDPPEKHGRIVQGVNMLKKSQKKFWGQFCKSVLARLRAEYWIRRIVYLYRRVRAYKIFSFYDKNAIDPDFSKKYVYLPLHLEPEASVCPMAGVYANQILMVQMLSEALPDDVLIYVKEHPSQQSYLPDGIGRASFFYQDIIRTPKVRFMRRQSNTYRLIENSLAVASGTGTAGVEGLFRGKPFLMFGHWSYQYAPGVFPIHSVEDCKKAVDIIIKGEGKPILRDLRIFFKALADVAIQGVIDERWCRHRPEDEERSIGALSGAFIDRIKKNFSHTTLPLTERAHVLA